MSPEPRVTTDETNARALLASQRKFLIAVATTVIGTGVLMLAQSVSRSIVTRSEFDMHAQQEREQIKEVRDIVLDMWCKENPGHRRCR